MNGIIAAVHFNYCGYKRPLLNARIWAEGLRPLANLGVEIWLAVIRMGKTSIPDLPDFVKILDLGEGAPVFQKETAANHMARIAGAKGFDFVWHQDADIIWPDVVATWEEIKRLHGEGFNIIQPFERMRWMNERGGVTAAKESWAKALCNSANISAPGLTWSHKTGNLRFWDRGIFGGADTVWARMATYNGVAKASPVSDSRFILADIADWYSSMPERKTTYVKTEPLHMWHGNGSGRKYNTRNHVLKDFRPWHMIEKNGVLQWHPLAPKKFDWEIKEYWKGRKEDGAIPHEQMTFEQFKYLIK